MTAIFNDKTHTVHVSSVCWCPSLHSLCFYSLVAKDKYSFTATNGADPVGLFHSVCTMAFPVEGVAIAIVNVVVVSALASTELNVVG